MYLSNLSVFTFGPTSPAIPIGPCGPSIPGFPVIPGNNNYYGLMKFYLNKISSVSF